MLAIFLISIMQQYNFDNMYKFFVSSANFLKLQHFFYILQKKHIKYVIYKVNT